MTKKDLDFHPITLADKEWMDPLLAQDDRNACEYTFANNFIWRNVYQVEVARIEGCGVIRFQENGTYAYSYPIGGGDRKAVIEKLLFLCYKNGEKLHMSPLTERDRKELIRNFPDQFLLYGDRDDYDYIYAREKLAGLAGKKLHGKRNHIARFKDQGEWSYEPMTLENIEECRKMTYEWIRMREEKWNEEMEQEIAVLHEAFDHFEALGLTGGILRQEGAIVAFTMGEPLNSETFVVHFEKAFPQLQGAYPMINQQFVQHACMDYAYVNREEDTGDPGLRKAKLSYYPEILLKKYIAEESEILFADKKEDRAKIQEIWQRCFGDEEEYVDLFLQNRMTEETMLLYCVDHKPVSMASFLPATYQQGEEKREAYYVYAVATLPEYRKHGYATKLLMFARAHYAAPLLLSPASEELEEYYSKMGFEPLTEGKNLVMLEAEEGSDEPFTFSEEISPADYVKIRDSHFAQQGYVGWDEAAIRYAMDENAYCGGKTLLISQGTDRELLMYRVSGENLIVEETTLSEVQWKQIEPELLTRNQVTSVTKVVHRGMVLFPEGEQTPVQKSGYLGLTLG